MKSHAALPALLLLGTLLPSGCAPASENRFAAYRTPDVPPECRAAVYNDPEVRQLIASGTAAPKYMATNQNKLAFKEAEVERQCMVQKGLVRGGGVEPVKYPWYPPLF